MSIRDGLSMAEKVARDFSLSALRNDMNGLQEECKKDDADPDDLEFDYEALKKVWDEYLSSQKSYSVPSEEIPSLQEATTAPKIIFFHF